MVKKLSSLALGFALTACGFQSGQASGTPGFSGNEHAGELDIKAAALLDGPSELALLPRIKAGSARQGEWLLIANHLHTKFSPYDGKQALADLITKVKSADFDGMILTDHNSMGGAETPEWKNSPLIMIKGMEWGALREVGETVVGHAGLIGLEGYEPLPTHASLEQMLALAKGRNAYVIANHPYCNGNSWTSSSFQPEVGAVEVWNGWWALVNPIMHNNDAKTLWEKHIAAGRRLTALGGSDSHGGSFYDNPARGANLVFARDRSPEAVMEAIKAGHVTVLADNKAPRMVLEADPARDGSWSAIEGDDVQVAQAGPVPMRVRVVGGKGLTVELLGKAGRLGAVKVQSQDAVVKFEAVGVPGLSDYVRAELKKHPGKWWSLTAMTNPIYVK